MSAPKGYSSQGKEDRLQAQFATVEPVRAQQNALSVLSHEFVYAVGTDAVEAGSTVSAIVATAHAAKKGDVIRITSGTLSGQEVKVWDVSANLITLAENLASAPAAAVTFQILRHKYPVVESTGEVKVTGTFVEVATAADGGALPALTKVVSGYDGSNVQVIKTDSSGELQVDVLSSALPTGAATEATLSTLNGKVTACNTGAVVVSSSALPSGAATEVTLAALDAKVTACNTGAVTVSSSALPTGAATESTLSTLNGKVTACNTGSVTIASSALPTGAATESTLSTLNGKVTACNTGAVTISSSALPTGAATETTLSAINTKTPSLGQAVMASSQPVVIASDQSAVKVTQQGRSVVTRARNAYSSTNVTTSSYTQLVASLGSAVNEIEIFDSSGETLVIATGAAGSESDQIYVFPGGNGRVPLAIAASARVSIKAVSASATSGEIAINFYA